MTTARTRSKGPLSRLIRGFQADRSGAAAVEFALVSSVFILTVMFVLAVAMMEFMGQTLDYATQKAARQVMTGQVQKSGMSQSSFLTSVICPALPSGFTCSNVVVNLYTVPYGMGPGGYYSYTNGNGASLSVPALSSGSSQFSPGQQGSYEYLMVMYPVTFFPAAFNAMLGNATFNGASAHLIIATAAFRNEQY